MKELIEFLKTHEFTEEVKQLTTLNVDGGSDSGEAILGNTNIVSFSEALKNNDTITSLDLRRNKIGDAGVIKIVESLENNNTITSLGFSSNDITDIGIKKISALLKHNNITSLELNYNEVTDKGSAIIVEALNSNTSLTKLFLGANNIKDATIIEALKYNVLTSLTLNANYIANNGAAKIGEYLASNNRIEDVERIGNALSNNKTLTHLDLNENNISDATAIVNGLEHNSTLTSLYISRTEYEYNENQDFSYELNPYGIEKINEFLERNKSLNNSSINQPKTNTTLDNTKDEVIKKDLNNNKDKTIQLIEKLSANNPICDEEFDILVENNIVQQTKVTPESDQITKPQSNSTNNNINVNMVNEIVYDNTLLNYPELIQLSLEEFNLQRIAELSNKLNPDLVQEAINNNENELVLAGLISLESFEV